MKDMTKKTFAFLASALCTLVLSSAAHANAKVFCTTANGGDWANASDINHQIAKLKTTQPIVQVSAPAIASTSPLGDGDYPNFELCVATNFGPQVEPKNSKVICTTANGGDWADPANINKVIDQLQTAGNNVQVSAPAITGNAPRGAGVYPNFELCVTLQY
jgi:hypothetical protein